jgi:hypothetical protein
VLRAVWFLLAVALPSGAKQITMRIPMQPGPQPEEVVVVTFDDSRISPADVKHGMLVHENGYYAIPVIGYYGDCKASAIPKMQEEIETAERVVDELDPNKYPPELSRAVMYLKDLQSLWLWLGEEELEFLKSGKAPDPEYKGTDLSRYQVISATLENGQACHQVFFDWHKCANDLVEAELGNYPKKSETRFWLPTTYRNMWNQR